MSKGIFLALSKHAAVLGDAQSGMCGPRWPLRLRAVEPELRHVPLQGSMGCTRRAAVLVHDPDLVAAECDAVACRHEGLSSEHVALFAVVADPAARSSDSQVPHAVR